MTDVVLQLAQFLAEATERKLGKAAFAYQLPDEVDEGIVVQRNKLNAHVPVQIDAGVHSLRVAVRAKSTTAAYDLADKAYNALLVDEDDAEAPGFISLADTSAQVVLYDRPAWQSQDQQGRKVFDFTVKLITKRN